MHNVIIKLIVIVIILLNYYTERDTCAIFNDVYCL